MIGRIPNRSAMWVSTITARQAQPADSKSLIVTPHSQRFRKPALRFSIKAAIPSLRSSIAKVA